MRPFAQDFTHTFLNVGLEISRGLYVHRKSGSVRIFLRTINKPRVPRVQITTSMDFQNVIGWTLAISDRPVFHLHRAWPGKFQTSTSI